MKISLRGAARLLHSLIFVALPVVTARGQSSRVPTIRLSEELVDFYAGDWIGRGSMTRSGEPMESEVTFTPVLRKEALSVHYQGRGSDAVEFLGFWSTSVQFDIVMSVTSDDDKGVRLFRAPGRQGSRLLVFETDPRLRLPSITRLERYSFERTSKDSFTLIYDYSVDGGNSWVVDSRQQYTRKT